MALRFKNNGMAPLQTVLFLPLIQTNFKKHLIIQTIRTQLNISNLKLILI